MFRSKDVSSRMILVAISGQIRSVVAVCLVAVALAPGTVGQQAGESPAGSTDGPDGPRKRKLECPAPEMPAQVISNVTVGGESRPATSADDCEERKSPLYDKDRTGEIEYSRPSSRKSRFNWNRALAQSATMLTVQHAFRLLQKKTYTELEGPFFRDWGKSVKALKGWGDSDGAFVNYFAHPLQGATTGRIFLTNSPGAESVPFGESKRYWKSRFKAFAWSAAWSAQFELGPLSEATIGNVGLRKKNGKGTMGWVDLVVTPTAGTAIIVGEDALERFVIRKMLRNGRATPKVKLLRSIFAPSHSLNNLLKGKAPWKREETIQFDDSQEFAKGVGNQTKPSR